MHIYYKRKCIYSIFSACFVLLLLLTVPIFGLFREARNTTLIAEMENRRISPAPTAMVGSKNFFQQVEAWYDDRVLGRKELIQTWSKLNGKLFHVLISKDVLQGKGEYLFFASYLSEEMRDREQILDHLSRVNGYCQAHGTHFVVFPVPPAEWMLAEQLPDDRQPVDVGKVESELKADLSARGIDYAMFATEMRVLPQVQRENMYKPGDYHWCGEGALYGTKALLQHLKLDQKIDTQNIAFHSEQITGGVYGRQIGWDPIVSTAQVPWSDEFTQEFDLHYHSGDVTVEGDGAAGAGEVIIYNPQAAHQITVLVLGDSFFFAMKPYLLQDVGTVIYTHNMDTHSPRTSIDLPWLMETYHPDIVIYEKLTSILFANGYNDNFGRWSEW